MALKLKEFDYKGFLLEKGERVGLYAAGGLALLMIVLSLFLPGKGLLSPSPKKSAVEIASTADKKKTDVLNAKPTESEADDLRKVPTELQKQASSVAEDPDDFRFAGGELFAPREIPSNKRQNPNILVPEEFLARYVPAQVSSYMFLNERDGVRIGILKGSPINLKGKNPWDAISKYGGMRGGMGGVPGGAGGMRGGAGMMGGPPGMGVAGGSYDGRNRGGMGSFGPPGAPGSPGGGAFGDEKKTVQINYIRKEDLNNEPNPVYARDLLPVPMAYLTGSFPLKAQIEEFKNALRADSAYNVVFSEMVGEKDKPRRAFQFLGFKVQRKTYGPDGKVIKGPDGNDWQDLDLESPNSAYILTAAQVLNDFEPEDPKIAPLLVHGLYLPRPVQIPVKHGDKTAPAPYPPIEEQLPKIAATLAKAKEKEPTAALPSSKLDEGASFNPFGDPDADKAGANDGKNLPTAAEWSPPDYCVVRFLDLTIQPGQSYEYQLKIRMRNPNWQKPESEVANKQLTVPPELLSDWRSVTGPDGKAIRVSVPTDLHLYAVDEQQAEVEEGKAKKDYKGMNANVTYEASKQVPIQIHRWMGLFEVKNRKPTQFFPVGDWVVGERIFATRGELVGVKDVPTHVPTWSPEQSQFTLAGRPPRGGGARADTRPTADVGFLEPRRAPLLVDFEGGNVTYRHAPPPPPRNDDGTPVEGYKPPPTTEVKSVLATDILLLAPDGKLLGRSSARDQYDEKRVEREKEYTERVANAESKDTPAAGGKADPFGGGGGKP